LTSIELVVTEVPRALRDTPETELNFDLTTSLRQADVMLEVVRLQSIDRLTLWRAGRLLEPKLRSLDAIHVVSALNLRPIEAFMSYDKRQIEAAKQAGLRTVSPLGQS
jgi:predicted nucleic acid-binding protein